MSVRVESAAWESLNGDWGMLYDEAGPAAGPFVTSEFLSAWWDVFGGGRELDLSAVRQNDSLIGVLPLQRHEGVVKLLGDFEICDYMDVLAAPGQEEAVVEALLDRLDTLAAPRADLRGLAESSSTLALLPERAAQRGWTVEREEEAICPVVSVPGDWESYVTGLRRKYRHEVRRKLRNLRSGKAVVELEVVSDPELVRERLPDFLRMMTTSRGDKAEFMTEQMATFFHAVVERLAPGQHLQMYFLLLDGKRVATVLCFLCRGQLMLYNSGYDPDFRALSVGIASKVFCMREAIDSGLEAVNFLRGSEEYKFQLGAEASPVTRLVLTR
ncbi:MAG TPA: GNAT family N-acetyltransferase [Dehalococcoidia bacterium]|nr:GNAT family N-acetyltransferase [Dehalococcoidia bacterium]